MAPPKKGPHFVGRYRLPQPLKDALRDLVEAHDSVENDEIVAAIAAHIRRHDPKTCQNLWCVARRGAKE